MKVVVTPHQKVYLDWCYDNDLKPKDVVWCDHPYKIYGLILNEEDIIRGHQWYLISNIQEELLSRIRRVSPTNEQKESL